MKLEHKGVGYESNFKPKSIDFKIGDPRVLITLVRDKLYSDKLRVFLQEYISNARDANREVGKPDHEIDITIPTRSEPLFKVRDYGPGLSTERVEDVFVQFGVSTKRATDTLLGGFGIGAKSAWAYTDSFVVISYHEGMERHYLCHLGGTTEGTMDLMHEGKTDKANGVEIQVQVKENDIQRAQYVLRFLLYTWKNKPNILNHQYEFKEPVEKPELGITLFEPSSFDSNLYLSLDGVPYQIKDHFLTNIFGNARGIWDNPTVVFRAQTGEVDVAANRENVELNDKYYDWIAQKRKQVVAGIFRMHFDAAQDGFKSYFDFRDRIGCALKLKRNKLKKSEEEDKAYREIIEFQNDKVFQFFDTLIEQGFELPENVAGFATLRDLLNTKNPREKRKADWLSYFGLSENQKGSLGAPESFVWYFEKEKILVLDHYVYPLDLLEKQLIVRQSKTTYTGWGRRRSGKEIFQHKVNIWGPLGSTHPITFSMLLPVNDYVKNPPLVYNDKPYTVEQFVKLNSRIPSSYKSMLDVTELPEGLKGLGLKSVTEILTPVYRAERQPRVRRESGTVRIIEANESNDFNFYGYQEASEADLVKKKEIVYILTNEKSSDWKPIMSTLLGRLSINGVQVAQISKTALEYLKAEGHTLTHWKDWSERNAVPETGTIPLSKKEIELFGACWVYDKNYAGYQTVTHYGWESLGIKHKDYLEFANLVRELKSEVRNDTVKSFVYDNRKRIESFATSKIFKVRMKLLKKYPLLPLVEQIHERRGNKTDILSSYLASPTKFADKMLKEYTDVSGWIKSTSEEPED